MNNHLDYYFYYFIISKSVYRSNIIHGTSDVRDVFACLKLWCDGDGDDDDGGIYRLQSLNNVFDDEDEG